MQKFLIVLIISSGLLVPGVAGAAPPAEPGAFGRHISICAREHGFDATHNPGSHQGRAGWDATPC